MKILHVSKNKIPRIVSTVRKMKWFDIEILHVRKNEMERVASTSSRTNEMARDENTYCN